MKEFIKKSLLKPWDIFIIILLVALSFLPVIIFSYQQANAAPEKETVLRVDGTEIKTFPLSVGSETYTYTYKDPHGDYNLIEIAGDKIRIKEADCDDQICVRRGWASKNGETIVCLPHKLVIEVRSTDGSDEDSLIY
ncbi:NusG domain II-containing protein [Enterococcus durans]|uniref:NusG domain II-containing protein n=1 Tax=Enterococcus durans TaxID=53345 RepID=UPI00115D3C1D|nr:NusG domain II-containing protein [Enterococcus durans]